MLLSLLLELLCGHPELYGQGASAERSRLVEGLNGALCVLDILVKNEVLLIGGRRVIVLTLAQLN